MLICCVAHACVLRPVRRTTIRTRVHTAAAHWIIYTEQVEDR